MFHSEQLRLTASTPVDDMETSGAEHVCIVTWCLVSGLVSVVGNTAVLLASSLYHAIRLDKIAVILITNLAIAGT